MRKLQPIGHLPAQSWKCSDCAFVTKKPDVGAYGWQTPNARAVALQMTFDRHRCEEHPKEASP